MNPDDIQFPPNEGHNVKVSVINGATSHMQADLLVHPPPMDTDKKHMALSGYSFLIESENRGQKILFDLAFMKDLDKRMPPALKAMFAGDDVMGIDEFHDVPSTIQAHGIDLASINAVIWSHAHIDHVGDPSVFPSNTDLVVGPGLKDACIPGYPTNSDSFVLDSAFRDRTVRELDFSTADAIIGGFRAVDFFEDGSFWLLEAPGHTAHHLCALCRTTDDSWVLLGGDTCHHVGQLRPGPFRPLPDDISTDTLRRISSPARCSCAPRSRVTLHGPDGPFYGLVPGMQEDISKALETVRKLQAFDGRDDVMVVLAHDASLLALMDFFPRTVNGWRSKGWGDRGKWLFLKEFGDLGAPIS